MKNDSLGDRMKRYENISRLYLQPKSYVIVRLDGKAFHTLTRQMEKPFDDRLIFAMKEALKYVCDNVMGCVL
jgi:tRNA(His) 5'-end guanylyltransferase